MEYAVWLDNNDMECNQPEKRQDNGDSEMMLFVFDICIAAFTVVS